MTAHQHSDCAAQLPCWEHFTHEADIGVRGIGHTLAEAFEQAALAMTAVVTDLDLVKPEQSYHLSCKADDPEFLLVNWLNTLVYEMAVEHLLFSRFEVDINELQLSATAWGEPVDIERQQPAVEIKGATLTELAVYQDDQQHWIAQCVVDV
jgi:SHS2 domain-containing protein